MLTAAKGPGVVQLESWTAPGHFGADFRLYQDIMVQSTDLHSVKFAFLTNFTVNQLNASHCYITIYCLEMKH